MGHLLEPENKAKLVAILEYHVVSGKITSNALKPEQDVKTLEGSDIEIAVIHAQGHTEVEINKHARVLKADVLASNGVMHVIDDVLIPKKMLQEIKKAAKASSQAEKNIFETTEATPDLSTLVTALKAGHFERALSGP